MLTPQGGVFLSKSLLIKNKIQMLETRGMLPWGLLHRVNPVVEGKILILWLQTPRRER
jgi:hypothetical protein